MTTVPTLRTERRRRSLLGSPVAPVLFVAPAVAFIAAFFGYPVVRNVTMSLQEFTTATFFTGEAPWVGLDNYVIMVSGALFRPALVNTLVFTVASIAFQFVLGLALAVFFQRRFPLSKVIRALLLLPWLLPVIVSSAVWRSILEEDRGILNSFLQGVHLIAEPIPWLTSPDMALLSVILVNIWLGLPFNLTLLYSGLQDIPGELYEAASLDGATGWKAFWYITLPSLRPVIAVVLVLGFVYTIKVLDLILGLTNGGPANATQTLALRSYQESFGEFQFGVGAAYSNALILISLIFALVYLRLNRKAVDE